MDNIGSKHVVLGGRSAPGCRPWISPRLLRLEAGKAEAGSNPMRAEGSFASGS
jgi:hypothetical protein